MQEKSVTLTQEEWEKVLVALELLDMGAHPTRLKPIVKIILEKINNQLK